MKPEDYGIVQSHKYRFVNFDFYKEPEGEWDKCPFCEQCPTVWIFDNGRSTACGCLLLEYNPYNHFAIYAESIMSHIKHNNGSCLDYDLDGLRKNWNHWCRTGEILFHRDFPKEGRW